MDTIIIIPEPTNTISGINEQNRVHIDKSTQVQQQAVETTIEEQMLATNIPRNKGKQVGGRVANPYDTLVRSKRIIYVNISIEGTEDGEINDEEGESSSYFESNKKKE